MKPTVGRIVHYTPEWAGPGNVYAKPLPAIIIEVIDAEQESVRVGVFGNSAYYTARALHIEPGDAESQTPIPGCWFWPPREPKNLLQEWEDRQG
jgi:hypothetical protein